MMRKISLLFVIGLIFSCNGINKTDSTPIKTKSEIVNEKVIAYIHNNANDPKSYEPITTYLEDSITYMKQLSNDINSYSTIDISSKDAFARESRNKWAELRKKRDSLRKSKFKDFTESYTFIHECRIKNGFGGLIKTSFKIVTDTKRNIISVKEN